MKVDNKNNSTDVDEIEEVKSSTFKDHQLLVMDKNPSLVTDDTQLDRRETVKSKNAKTAAELRLQGVLTIPDEEKPGNCRSKLIRQSSLTYIFCVQSVAGVFVSSHTMPCVVASAGKKKNFLLPSLTSSKDLPSGYQIGVRMQTRGIQTRIPSLC